MKTASMKEKFYILIIFLFFSNFIFGQKAKLNISIDDRIETLYSVAYFDNYFLVNKHANIYKNTLDQKLASLKNHRAVALFDTISKKYNFSYYRPIEWILQYSDFPKFEKIKTKSDAEDESITKGKEYLLEEFRNELTKFNQDSLFQNYLKAIKPINEKIITKIFQSNTIKHLPDYLEEYYGTKLSSYNLILSPLVHSGGFNAEITNQKGEKEVYAVIGPNGEIDFYPHFDNDYLETDMILHEFGHSFVNPLSKKHEKEIENLRTKYYDKKLEKSGKQQGYSQWKYVFNEILLRAIVINISRSKFGNEKADKLLEFEKSVGFELVETVSKKLNIYETNRKKYKKFEEFYPVLLNELK
jgi:hypothetical protein